MDDLKKTWVRCEECGNVQTKYCAEGEATCFFCEADLMPLLPMYLEDAIKYDKGANVIQED